MAILLIQSLQVGIYQWVVGVLPSNSHRLTVLFHRLHHRSQSQGELDSLPAMSEEPCFDTERRYQNRFSELEAPGADMLYHLFRGGWHRLLLRIDHDPGGPLM